MTRQYVWCIYWLFFLPNNLWERLAQRFLKWLFYLQGICLYVCCTFESRHVCVAVIQLQNATCLHQDHSSMNKWLSPQLAPAEIYVWSCPGVKHAWHEIFFKNITNTHPQTSSVYKPISVKIPPHLILAYHEWVLLLAKNQSIHRIIESILIHWFSCKTAWQTNLLVADLFVSTHPLDT